MWWNVPMTPRFRSEKNPSTPLVRNQLVALALNVLPPHVLDGVVIESSAHAAIAIMIVRVHVRPGGDILVDNSPQILASDFAKNLAANLAAALQDRNDRDFIIWQPFAANLAFHFSFDVSFVHLNRAGQVFHMTAGSFSVWRIRCMT